MARTDNHVSIIEYVHAPSNNQLLHVQTEFMKRFSILSKLLFIKVPLYETTSLKQFRLLTAITLAKNTVIPKNRTDYNNPTIRPTITPASRL